MPRPLLLALATAMLTACSAGEAVSTPPEPPAATLEKPPRAPWGDEVGARVGGLAGHIHDQLRDPYGTVRETQYIGRDEAAVAALRDWYRIRLGAGWSAKPLSLLPEEHGFAFVAGGRALAVGWLDRLPDGRVPVVVMHYGDRL